MRRFMPLMLVALLVGCTASATGSLAPGSTASPGASAGPSAAPSGAAAAPGVTFTTAGRPFADSGVVSAYDRGDTNLEIQFGQAIGRLPGEAIMALQITVDKAKKASGTYGTDDVTQVNALLRIIKGGTYSYQWKPSLQGDPITFSLSVAGGKATTRWAGKMKQAGGSDEQDVVAEVADAPIRPK